MKEDAVKPKVLQVVEPGCDGVFRHVEGLVDYLHSKDVPLDLAYSDVRGSDRLKELVSRVVASGGEVVNLRVSNAPSLGDIPALLRLLECQGSRKYSVIHAHSSKAGILGKILSIVSRTPCFYTPNAYYGMGRGAGVKTAVFNAIERIFAPVGMTINVSSDEADFARLKLGVHAERQVVIPNAVDTDHYRRGTSEERHAWRQVHGIPDEAIVIGTLGRLSFQKDPMTLYRAFLEVARDQPALYLAHVGSGELDDECRAVADSLGMKDRVIRIGYLKDTAGFYRALDAFALTSRYEGLSFAVLEALASDLPMILSEAPGNLYFKGIGLSHLWTAPVGSVDDVAAGIRSMLAGKREGRLPNHREVAMSRFGFDACYGKILRLYERAVEKSSWPE
jgi:glycosyltransferase involved in cell wall biosynthesis